MIGLPVKTQVNRAGIFVIRDVFVVTDIGHAAIPVAKQHLTVTGNLFKGLEIDWQRYSHTLAVITRRHGAWISRRGALRAVGARARVRILGDFIDIIQDILDVFADIHGIFANFHCILDGVRNVLANFRCILDGVRNVLANIRDDIVRHSLIGPDIRSLSRIRACIGRITVLAIRDFHLVRYQVFILNISNRVTGPAPQGRRGQADKDQRHKIP